MKVKLLPVLLISVIFVSSCNLFVRPGKTIEDISAWGPIETESNDIHKQQYLVQIENPENKIELKLINNGDRESYVPPIPLETGEIYLLFGEDGSADGSRKFVVRAPCLVYLNGVSGEAEVFLDCPGKNPVQITKTNSKVMEYQISIFGDRIFYSIFEGENGSVLNSIKVDGSDLRHLYDCSPFTCSNLAYSPIPNKIAFVKEGADPEIIILDLDNQTIEKIECAGIDLRFSPDGQYFSFFDSLTSQLNIINLDNMEKTLIPSSSGLAGEWSNDSNAILYGSYDYWGGIPGVHVHKFHIESGIDMVILSNQDQEYEFYSPSFTDVEGLYFANVRQRNAGPSSQLCLLDDKDTINEVIIADPLFHYSSFSWNSGHTQLAFQRYPINLSNGSPEIVIWDKENKSIRIVAKKGSKPLFLP